MKLATTVAMIGFLFVGRAVVLSLDEASERGRQVYAAQKCALCHSIGGIGGKKSDLDRVGAKLKAEEMKKWIRTPKAMKADTTMKSYPNLPEKDLNDLIAFLMTLR